MAISKNQKGTCPHCKTPNRFEGVLERDGSGTTRFDDYHLVSGPKNFIKKLRSCRCTECGVSLDIMDSYLNLCRTHLKERKDRRIRRPLNGTKTKG